MLGEYEDPNYKGTGKEGTRNIKGNEHGPQFMQVDEEGNILGGEDNPQQVNIAGGTLDNNKYFTLKSDITAATSDTNVVTVAQTGIKKASIANPSTTVTMYVAFGADPASGAQYVLPPLSALNDLDVDNKSGMRYKSSVAGGQLIYDLRG